MYTQNANEFVAYIGGRRTYKFDKNKPGDKARAQRQMETETAAIVNATQQRAVATLGRELTHSELIRGKDIVKDARPLREKIKTESKGHGSTERSPSENPYHARVEFLEKELVNRPSREHAGIRYRLEMATKAAKAFDVQLAETNERIAKLTTPLMNDVKVYANAWLARLSTNPDPVCQPWLENYRKALAEVEKTGDVEAFWKFNSEFEAERTKVLTERADQYAQKSEELKLAAEEILSQTVETPAEDTGVTNE